MSSKSPKRSLSSILSQSAKNLSGRLAKRIKYTPTVTRNVDAILVKIPVEARTRGVRTDGIESNGIEHKGCQAFLPHMRHELEHQAPNSISPDPCILGSGDLDSPLLRVAEAVIPLASKAVVTTSRNDPNFHRHQDDGPTYNPNSRTQFNSSTSSLTLPASPSPSDFLEMNTLSISDRHQYQTLPRFATMRDHILDAQRMRDVAAYRIRDQGRLGQVQHPFGLYAGHHDMNTHPAFSPATTHSHPLASTSSSSRMGGVTSETPQFNFIDDCTFADTYDTPSLAIPALCRDPSASPSPITDPFTPTDIIFAQPHIVDAGEYIGPNRRLQEGGDSRFSQHDSRTGQLHLWQSSTSFHPHAQPYPKFNPAAQYRPLGMTAQLISSSGSHGCEAPAASVPASTTAYNADLSWTSTASSQTTKSSASPILHHPRPYRPYVPKWQVDPDIDFEQFVLPKVPCSTPVDPPPSTFAFTPLHVSSASISPTLVNLPTSREFPHLPQCPRTPIFFNETQSDEGMFTFELQDVSMETEVSDGSDEFEWPGLEDGDGFTAERDSSPEVQVQTEEDIEVGPAIGLGAHIRMLDLDSLLFQSVPDSVKYPDHTGVVADA